ncbi:hypothetical protein [Bacillus sp. NPDC094106]|uniref:hypothetical protein n=1 Tax=Bacillus sp. NPDC094106 TaxID=3363949 RepID=UPI0038256DF7
MEPQWLIPLKHIIDLQYRINILQKDIEKGNKKKEDCEEFINYYQKNINNKLSEIQNIPSCILDEYSEKASEITCREGFVNVLDELNKRFRDENI